MRLIKPLMTAAALALPAAGQASPPLPPETIAAIDAALSECTGGWQTIGVWKVTSAADLRPRLALLSRPSTDLTDEAGMDLYKIANGLLFPAVGARDWILDGRSPTFKCPARPAEGVAVMEYLVGERPSDRRGATNAFDWLGAAYEMGVAGPADPERARRYFLRSRIHSVGVKHDRWSDGIDQDLLGNIDRAGMRPYLEAAAAAEHGGAARMILAEEVLAADPARARELLRTLYTPALNRLIALEEAGQVPTVANAEDIAFWAEAWRTQLGYQTWARRMLKGALLANSGLVPVAPERPSIEALRRYLDSERVADAPATRVPIPVRALVDPSGRAIYAEACRANQTPHSGSAAELGVRLDATRLYNHTALPKLPVATIDGRPVYTWVILPAVHFQRPQPDKLEIAFVDLPAERCAYSDMMDTPVSTPAPPPSPRPAPPR
jgi:hypothetical protein